ncbi:MAG: hypothetical protein NT166_20730 [Candidatus Aminicenantes bacterium]|nr:hypothetical protein [Candidatus Aminicenantes bacterium]
MRIRNILTIILVAALFTGALLLSGCKKSSEADASYVLTVSIVNGVNGTPATGSYTYKKDDQVPYNYSLKEAYKDLKVTLDAATVANSGVITISGNHTLLALADPDAAAFSLTVSVSAGVEGTPAAGITYYLPNTQVDYNYSLKEDYIDLKVTLDGAVIANSGAATITKNSQLAASATLHYDIRDTWELTESYSDGSSFSGALTFTGTSQAGAVFDSDGGIGTFTVQGTYIIFTLGFPSVTYEYTGLFAAKDTISGTSRRIIVASGKVNGGTWRGVRHVTAASAAAGSRTNKGEIDIQ